MNKNVSHISQRIVCPKCGTRNLRKSLSSNNLGKEYFCDKDHEYFGIVELANKWGYDVADFYCPDGFTQLSPTEFVLVDLVQFDDAHKNAPVVEEKIISTNWFDGESTYSCDEPVWTSKTSRDESYKVVNRMLSGIEELEWEFDVDDLPFPILQTGLG